MLALLYMTMALAVAMVACERVVEKPASPTIANTIVGMAFDVGDGPTTITLTGYFNATDPTYSARSSKTSVATATVSEAVLTVTPKAAGTTNVTVTAKDNNGTVSQTFTVTVKAAAPPPANNPPTVRTIPDESLMVGETESVTLSRYADDPEGDALTYSAASNNDAVATASVAGAELTITAVAVGTATITVTVSDGTSSVDRVFDVMVSAAPPVDPPVDPDPNERPEQELIDDIGIDELRREGTIELDLSMYYDDPDGDDLSYTAISSNEMFATVSVSGSMLTITGAGVGTARITVTASDGTDEARQTFSVTVGSQAPRKHNVSTQVSLDGVGDTAEFTLSDYFTDPEGDELTFATDGSTDVMVATASDPDADDMITITAVGPGSAMITVTAADSDNDPVELVFFVTVGAPPVENEVPTVADGIDDMDLIVGETDSVTLSMHFTDSDAGDALMFTASSSDEMVATEMVDGSMLTITAVAVGMAEITVTATDSHGALARTTFTVTVSAPPPPNMTPESSPMPTVNLTAGDTDTVSLSDYFTDPDGDDADLMYEAESDATSIATVTDPDADDMITITAVNAGRAWVTVTAMDEEGAKASTRFLVVVLAAAPPEPPAPPPANMPPEPVPGKNLDDLLIQIIDGGIGGTGDTATEANTADNRTINLSEYFSDPDGVQLYYRVTKTETPETSGNTVIELHSTPAVTTSDSEAAASGSAPDYGPTENMLVIEPHNSGKATVTVTVKDVDNASITATFMVTVAASGTGTNSRPTIQDGSAFTEALTALDDAVGEANPKLKIEESRKVLDNVNFFDHFRDADFTKGDMLEFSTEVRATATGADLAADKRKVMAEVMPSTWSNGSPTAKFTLTVTGKEGTGTTSQFVAIIATDRYGLKAEKTLEVQVNHDPMAYGAQEDKKYRKTLSGEDMYMDMTVPVTPYDTEGTAAPTDANSELVTLVQDAAASPTTDAERKQGGYFSDKDLATDLTGTANNVAGCVIKGTGGTADVAYFQIMDVAKITLRIAPLKIGTKTVTIACKDTFGVESPPDTLTVKVTSALSGSRQ